VTQRCREAELLPDVWTADPGGGTAEAGDQFEDAVLRRTEKLSIRTRTNPHDIVAWLQYVQHHEDILRAGSVIPHL
jgi:hypothetical protein